MKFASVICARGLTSSAIKSTRVNSQRHPRILVVSAIVRAIGYCPVRKILEIEFRAEYVGGVYQFHGVQEWTILEFVRSNSKGSFYFNSIRHKYRGFEVDYDLQIFRSPAPGEKFIMPRSIESTWPATPCGTKSGQVWTRYWLEQNWAVFKSKLASKRDRKAPGWETPSQEP